MSTIEKVDKRAQETSSLPRVVSEGIAAIKTLTKQKNCAPDGQESRHDQEENKIRCD